MKTHQTCDQLASDPARYAAFVETEKPFDEYVRGMRQPGTYGGHLELAAFAQLQQKHIRIVQPDWVYVVACDESTRAAQAAYARRERARQAALDAGAPNAPKDTALSARDLRRTRRSQQRARADTTQPSLETVGPLYIAYHNWEHYSSLRSLRGPHQGLPRLEAVPGAHTAAAVDLDAEELVLRSAPGYSREHVRRLLAETPDVDAIVERLVAGDTSEPSSPD